MQSKTKPRKKKHQPSDAASTTIKETDLPPSLGVAVRETVALAQLPAFFARAFHDIDDAIVRGGGQCAGAPFAQYHSMPPAPIDVEAVFPVNAHFELDDEAKAKGVQLIDIPGGGAVEVLHVGSYDALGPVYAGIFGYLRDKGLEPAGPPREIYLTSPSDTAPNEHRTVVVVPFRQARASTEPAFARARA